MSLEEYGWNGYFADVFATCAGPGLEPARIVFEDNVGYRAHAECGDVSARISGRLRHDSQSREDLPAVGDWVAIKVSDRDRDRLATIHAVLPRRSRFVRKVAGAKTEQQIVGANIDTVLLVTALNSDFTVRRIERYLLLAQESGAEPVIVLSKADLCENVARIMDEVSHVVRDVPVHSVSVFEEDGVNSLRPYFRPGETVALLGSSGVGKSTLINFLLGFDRQKIADIRESDGRGKHTTRHRELILLPQGGLVLDTPGMRELQLWEGSEGLRETFEDIEAIALTCRFSNCGHESEPGCAIREAVAAGVLDRARLDSYVKLQKEVRSFEIRHDALARRANQQKWKKLSREAKDRARLKRGGGGS